MQKHSPSPRRSTVATGIYLENGSFVAGFSHPTTGSWTTKTLKGVVNLTAAKRARRDLLADLAAGRIAPTSTLTLAGLSREWLATREGRVKARTLEADTRNVDLIARHFVTAKVQDVDGRRVERFLAALRAGEVGRSGKPMSEWSCVGAYSTLSMVFDWAVANGVLVGNPCDRIQKHTRPKQVSRRKPRVLTPAELDALVAAADRKTPAFAGLIAVLAYTGCRAREANGLRWGDVDSTAKLVAFSRQIDKAGTALVAMKTTSAERTNAVVPALDRFLGREARMEARWSADDDYDRVQRDKAQAEQAARQMQAELEQVRAQGPVGGPAAGGGADGEQQALRVLMMAQRTADDHVADARREADKLLSDARSKAEEVTREARAKADALERDARQRHQEAMGGLDAKRSALQKHIEELKQFEREYRTRLKAYLESQLRDLDGRGQGLEAEMSRADAGRAVGGSGGLAAAGLAGSYGGTRAGAIESGR